MSKKVITIDNQEIKVEVEILKHVGDYNTGHSSLVRYTPIVNNVRWRNFVTEQWEDADYTQKKTLVDYIQEGKAYANIVKAIKTHNALERLGVFDDEKLWFDYPNMYYTWSSRVGAKEYKVIQLQKDDLLASNLPSLATRIKEGIVKAKKEWEQDQEQKRLDDEARELAKLEAQRLLEEQKRLEQEELDALDKVGL